MQKSFYLLNPESQCYFLEILEILRKEFRITRIYVVHDWRKTAQGLYVLNGANQPELTERFAVVRVYKNIALIVCYEIKKRKRRNVKKYICDWKKNQQNF